MDTFNEHMQTHMFIWHIQRCKIICSCECFCQYVSCASFDWFHLSTMLFDVLSHNAYELSHAFSCGIQSWLYFSLRISSQWPRANQISHPISHPNGFHKFPHLQVCFPFWSNVVVKIMVSSSFVPPLIIPPMMTSSRFALHALELPHRRLQLIALRHSSLVSKNVPSWFEWNYCMATRTIYLARDGKSMRFHTLAILGWNTSETSEALRKKNAFDFRLVGLFVCFNCTCIYSTC